MEKAVLGIIPAREGSRGIPEKNIRLLAGRPLLEYTVKAAFSSGVIDRLILSTDSEKIASLGRRLGVEVPFLRPKELAQDETPMLPVLQHAVSFLEERGWFSEIVVLLQPTAPLRKPQHIRDALSLLRSTHCDSVVSVTEIPLHFSPDYVMKIVDGKLLNFLPEGKQLTRRQEARPAYSRDGTVYAVRRDVLMDRYTLYGTDCRPLLIPREESITLDTWEDWERAERRLIKMEKQIKPE